jgi:SAM-dependent methyltransferase
MTPSDDQQVTYEHRFAGNEARRSDVWRNLVRYYFQRWVKSTDTVVDLGAGYCEFINNVSAGRRYALDSNPSTLEKAARNVCVLSQDASEAWQLPTASVDVVFSSNFFEHLQSKKELSLCLAEACRVLRPGGLLIALGPNIRYCFDEYWDFIDHQLPLSDRSMMEALEITGFQKELLLPRFLPFTMSTRIPHWAFLVRMYLGFPLAQKLWGKQFLVIARKRSNE